MKKARDTTKGIPHLYFLTNPMTTKTDRKLAEEIRPLMALFCTFRVSVINIVFCVLYKYLIVLIVRNRIVRRTHNPGFTRLKGSFFLVRKFKEKVFLTLKDNVWELGGDNPRLTVF